MINWSTVLNSVRHENATVDFVEQSISLRDFQRRLDASAKKEINKVSKRGAQGVRVLARKALNRRGINYSLVG